jgi:HEAT repeat protein
MIMSMTRHLTKCTAWLCALALCTHALFAAKTPVDSATQEQKDIAVLQSDTGKPNKALACKRLAVYGSGKAVAVLAPLLSDPELASWCRIALEAIPDPACDGALLSAAGKLKGRLLVGTINSIAVRRDKGAVPLLTQKLDDNDTDVASAAAVALGCIGGKAAANALTPRLARAPAQVRPAVAEGCIRAAEALLTASQHSDAMALYDAVRAAPVSKQKRIEATRGAILARGTDGISLLAEQLASKDKDIFGLGLRTARELALPDVAEVLLAAIEHSGPRRQAYLLIAMADRGDKATLAAARKAAGSEDLVLRTEAVRVLGLMADAGAAAILLDAALHEDTALAKEARTALARMAADPAIDKAVLGMLGDKQTAKRLLAVQLVSERRLANAVPLLMGIAGDPDEKVRVAALKTLGNLADRKQLPAILDRLLTSTSSRELRATESLVTAICQRNAQGAPDGVTIKKARYGDLPHGRSRDVTQKVAALVRSGKRSVQASNGNFGDPAGGTVKKLTVEYVVDGRSYSKSVMENDTLTLTTSTVDPGCVDAVLAAFGRSAGKPKAALLGVLGSLGGGKALTAVRTASGDADPETREAAVRSLFDWPAPSALPDLARLSREADKPSFKILALRGYIRLVAADSTLPAKKLAALEEALSLATRKEEKTLVLAAAGSISTVEALDFVSPHLADVALKEEARAAVLSIAGNLRGKLPPQVRQAVETVAKTSRNTLIAKRAKALMDRIGKER